jgi:hypothetical protein
MNQKQVKEKKFIFNPKISERKILDQTISVKNYTLKKLSTNFYTLNNLILHIKMYKFNPYVFEIHP